MKGGATLSDCQQYRYLLRRTWDNRRPRTLFVMLNPSTADAEVDDATIRSCIRLCRAWSFGSFEVVNLFGWRATDPDELSRVDDPIGPENDTFAEAAIIRNDMTICAWGANPIADTQKGAMFDLIGRHRPAAWCLGLTKHGAPKHPLHIKTGTPLVLY